MQQTCEQHLFGCSRLCVLRMNQQYISYCLCLADKRIMANLQVMGQRTFCDESVVLRERYLAGRSMAVAKKYSLVGMEFQIAGFWVNDEWMNV